MNQVNIRAPLNSHEKGYRQPEPRLAKEMAKVYYKWTSELIILFYYKVAFPASQNPYPVVFFSSINFHVFSILWLFQ